MAGDDSTEFDDERDDDERDDDERELDLANDELDAVLLDDDWTRGLSVPWGTYLWSVGGIAVLTVVFLALAGDWHAGLGRVFVLIVLVLACAWGVARWAAGRRHPQGTVGIGFTVLSWFAIGALLRTLFLGVLPAVLPLGSLERALLVPPLGAGLMALAGQFHFDRWLSRLAAFLIVLAFLGPVDGGDDSRPFVSAAGPADLATAERTGGTILLRGRAGSPHESSGVEGTSVPGATDCRHVALDDRRLTLAGREGRRLVVRVDACWNGEGVPVSVVVTHHTERGAELADPRSVRLVARSPFELDRYRGSGPTRDYPYGSAAAGTERPVFDGQGRVQDGSTSADLVIARVDRRFHVITLVFGVRQRDPVVQSRDEGSGAGDGSDRSIAVATDERQERGRILDVVTARLHPAGGGDIHVSRFTAGDPKPLAEADEG